MNLYFLVEGRRTEARLYPRWLSYLLPHFSRVEYPDEASNNTFFLISGEGYPRLLDVQLPHAIQDVNDVGRYDYLIVCLDADEATVAERTAEVWCHLEEQQTNLNSSTTFRIGVSKRGCWVIV